LRRCHNHKVCEREVRSADELKICAPIESRFDFQQMPRNLGASHDVFEGIEVARCDCNKTKNRNSFYIESYHIKFTPNLRRVTSSGVHIALKTGSPWGYCQTSDQFELK
jgi:hypothetical protein